MKIICKAILTDSAGKVLVLRRSSTHPYFAHHLDFPGGDVEYGEPEAAAVVREAQEEAGIEIPVSSLKLVHQRQLPGEIHRVFAGSLPSTQPPVMLSWEHDQYEWVTPQQLLSRPVPPGVDSYYETALEYIKSLPK